MAMLVGDVPVRSICSEADLESSTFAALEMPWIVILRKRNQVRG